MLLREIQTFKYKSLREGGIKKTKVHIIMEAVNRALVRPDQHCVLFIYRLLLENTWFVKRSGHAFQHHLKSILDEYLPGYEWYKLLPPLSRRQRRFRVTNTRIE